MKRIFHIVLATVAVCIALTACSDNTCNDNGSSLPLAQCYVGNAQQTISGLTVKGINVPGDSLLVSSASLKEIYLPLRASVSSTSYQISRSRAESATVNDTVTINYQAIEFFHSIECGAMYNFDIQDVSCTKHGIDSVVVLSTLVTNSRIPALRIYFKQ